MPLPPLVAEAAAQAQALDASHAEGCPPGCKHATINAEADRLLRILDGYGTTRERSAELMDALNPEEVSW